MHRSRRGPNPGLLRKMVSKIRLSVRGSVSGLTRRGILASQQVRAHIFGTKPNPRCHPGATSMIIANLFLGRMRVSPGIICKSGPNFMKRALRFRTLATQIASALTEDGHDPIIVHDGERALDKTKQKFFDLILLALILTLFPSTP